MDLQRRRRRDQVPPLDLNLAERVLSGALAPEDLPPALGPMAQALNAIRPDSVRAESLPAESVPADSMRAEADRRTIDSMVAFLSDSARHPSRRPRSPVTSSVPRHVAGFRLRPVTALVAAVMAFLLGMAYAGRLPAPAQNAVSVALSKVGLSVPRHHGAGHDAKTGETPGGTGDAGAVGPDANGAAHDGLCNAYFNGDGGTNGGKLDSVAFQNVQKAADTAGQTVEEFCGVDAATSGAKAGKGDKGQGSEKSKDDSGDGSESDGQAKESGDQGKSPGDEGSGSKDGSTGDVSGDGSGSSGSDGGGDSSGSDGTSGSSGGD